MYNLFPIMSIIGLPIYLVHWLWAERLAQRDEEERQATLRGLYLYVMLTAFLTPFIANAYSFVQAALRLILGVKRAIPTWRSELPGEDTLLFTLIAMLVLALLGGYHIKWFDVYIHNNAHCSKLVWSRATINSRFPSSSWVVAWRVSRCR